MIPHIIHSIFYDFGEGKTIQDYPRFVECADHNERFAEDNQQTYCYLLWDKIKCDALIRDRFSEYQNLWDDFVYPIQKVDFIRYCILYTFGGIYLDLDVKIIQNPEPLLSDPCFFTSWTDDKRQLPYNAIMGAESDLKLFEDILKHCQESFYEKLKVKQYETWKGRFVFQTSGHFMLQRVLKRHKITPKDLLKVNTKDGKVVSSQNPYFEDFNISSWYN